MKSPLKFYLERMNPFVALFILVWCLWIYFCPLCIQLLHHEAKWKMLRDLIDSREYYIQMYILIKGVFCALMLWLVGDYFKRQIDDRRN